MSSVAAAGVVAEAQRPPAGLKSPLLADFLRLWPAESPRVTYPLHHHEAEVMYLPLSGTTGWKLGAHPGGGAGARECDSSSVERKSRDADQRDRVAGVVSVAQR
jgi:hypothetical protein